MSAAGEESAKPYFALATNDVAGGSFDMATVGGGGAPSDAAGTSYQSDDGSIGTGGAASSPGPRGAAGGGFGQTAPQQRLSGTGTTPASLSDGQEPAGFPSAPMAGQAPGTAAFAPSNPSFAADTRPGSLMAPDGSGGAQDPLSQPGTGPGAAAPGAAIPAITDVQDDAGVVTLAQSGSGGTGSSGGGSAGTGTSGGSGAAQHLVINLTFDSSANSAPAAFKTAVTAAAQFFEDNFSNPVTINIDVGYGEINGSSMGGGALGESETYLYNYSFSQLAAALRADPTAAADVPATDPTNGGQFWVTTAEAEALGLAASSQGLDGYVGFSSGLAFDYNNSDGVSPGAFDFFGVATHEISEVLGRQMMDGSWSSFEPLDLFHYSAPGVRSFSGTKTSYFSIDGGVTNLGNFNTNPGGDFGDWAGSVGNNAFLAFTNSGVVDPVTSADLTLMNALGWTPITATAAPQSSPPARVASDFNGDGMSDILWRNASAGATSLWEMSGSTVIGGGPLSAPSPQWQIAGVGDFNGDGTADILWQNTASGALALWEMNGTSVIGGGPLAAPPASWQVAGLGDFNGDGKTDVLWRNSQTGAASIWEMNGTGVIGGGPLAGAPPPSWKVAGVADFNGDGMADILWQNTSTGQLGLWEMSGTSVIGGGAIAAPSAPWQIAGLGDFNGGGTTDILWRNTQTGAASIWEMNGTAIIGGGPIANAPSTAWQVAGIGDYNGDGKSDILWQNTQTGAISVWEMNGTAPIGGGAVGALQTSWQAAHNPILAA